MANDMDQEIINDLVLECMEQLDEVMSDILNLEENRDMETVNKIFRLFHSVKGNISMMGFMKCSEFAHKAEDVVSLIRKGELNPDKEIVNVLLISLDTLKILLKDIRDEGNDDRNVYKVYQMLEQIELTVASRSSELSEKLDIKETGAGISQETGSKVKELPDKVTASVKFAIENQKMSHKKALKVLVAEDDFHSRLLLQEMLSSYGTMFPVMNGEEAVLAFQDAFKKGDPYDLISLDIDMPVKNGHIALKEIREFERLKGVLPGNGVKIIMTTAFTDPKTVMKSFAEMCNAYIFKPINMSDLKEQLKNLKLIS